MLSAQTWWPAVTRLVTSDETKAMETATVVAERHGLTVEVRPATGEIDRSATGYVPAEEHDTLAAALFAHPERSARGWERAVDAQHRIVAAVADLLADGVGDVAVVGHGGVGTLLLCHLAGLGIDQRHDQPSQGHYWTWDRTTRTLVHPWLAHRRPHATRPGVAVQRGDEVGA